MEGDWDLERFEGGPKTNMDRLGDLQIASTYQQLDEVTQGISKILLPKHRRFKGSVSGFKKKVIFEFSLSEEKRLYSKLFQFIIVHFF
jgi:hypothetical protein